MFIANKTAINYLFYYVWKTVYNTIRDTNFQSGNKSDLKQLTYKATFLFNILL